MKRGGEVLKEDHSQDLTIPFRLADAIVERGYPYDLDMVSPQGIPEPPPETWRLGGCGS